MGARIALYRVAMFVAGRLAITLAAAGVVGARQPRPGPLLRAHCCSSPGGRPSRSRCPSRRSTLKDAVWGPFVGFLAQHRALEILAFVVLYKLSDNLTQALTRPVPRADRLQRRRRGRGRGDDRPSWPRVVGTFLGGLLTNTLGLGRALWVFGFLQIFSNLGYALVAQVGVNRPVMYGAVAFEHGLLGAGQRCLRRAPAAHDPEALLGHAVRALLQPLRDPAHPGRAAGGSPGRRAGLARLLPAHAAGRHSRPHHAARASSPGACASRSSRYWSRRRGSR